MANILEAGDSMTVNKFLKYLKIKKLTLMTTGDSEDSQVFDDYDDPVMIQLICSKALEGKVWTLCNDGHRYVAYGLCFVNRLGYYLIE